MIAILIFKCCVKRICHWPIFSFCICIVKMYLHLRYCKMIKRGFSISMANRQKRFMANSQNGKAYFKNCLYKHVITPAFFAACVGVTNLLAVQRALLIVIIAIQFCHIAHSQCRHCVIHDMNDIISAATATWHFQRFGNRSKAL